MATIGEIRERVREILIHVPPATEDALDLFIRRKQRELEDRHGFPVLRALQQIAIFPLGTSHAIALLETDWNGRRDLPYVNDGTGKTYDCPWIEHPDEWREIFDLDPEKVGRPERIRIAFINDLQYIEVFPLPDLSAPSGILFSDGKWRLNIPYWKRLPVLSNENPSNWFSTNCQDYLTWGAAAEGSLFNRNYAEAANWAARADQEIKRLERRQKLEDMGATIQLFPSEGVHRTGGRSF